jgi:hypothetical protein
MLQSSTGEGNKSPSNMGGTRLRPDEHKAAMKRVADAVGRMDLPPHRKNPTGNDCLRWLAKCLHQRNADHPKFQEAVAALAALGHRTVLVDRK